MRIWDCYLAEGIKFVFRVCLAMIKMKEDTILKMTQFEPLMKFMQSIHTQIPDADSLLKKAFDLPLKHEHLDALQDRYDRMTLQKQREKRKNRRGGGNVSDMKQPAIVQRLSKSVQSTSIDSQSLKVRTMSDHKESDTADEDSESELEIKPVITASSRLHSISQTEPTEPDLNFEPKSPSNTESNIRSPSDSDLTFKPQSNDSINGDKQETKEEADCNRYDEGSHSESSMDKDSSSDLPDGKHHDPVPPPEDIIIDSNSKTKAVTEHLDQTQNDENAENEDLLQNEKE